MKIVLILLTYARIPSQVNRDKVFKTVIIKTYSYHQHLCCHAPLLCRPDPEKMLPWVSSSPKAEQWLRPYPGPEFGPEQTHLPGLVPRPFGSPSLKQIEIWVNVSSRGSWNEFKELNCVKHECLSRYGLNLYTTDSKSTAPTTTLMRLVPSQIISGLILIN